MWSHGPDIPSAAVPQYVPTVLASFRPSLRVLYGQTDGVRVRPFALFMFEQCFFRDELPTKNDVPTVSVGEHNEQIWGVGRRHSPGRGNDCVIGATDKTTTVTSTAITMSLD